MQQLRECPALHGFTTFEDVVEMRGLGLAHLFFS